MDANPPEVQFKWTFNNSAESIDVAAGHIARAGTSSIVSYTPMTELDYGTLLCWASNHIGQQQVPCVYHIIPAGKGSLHSHHISWKREATYLPIRSVNFRFRPEDWSPRRVCVRCGVTKLCKLQTIFFIKSIGNISRTNSIQSFFNLWLSPLGESENE